MGFQKHFCRVQKCCFIFKLFSEIAMFDSDEGQDLLLKPMPFPNGRYITADISQSTLGNKKEENCKF